ncbi:hypothetical protein MMC09_005088 [Bachmanniomyces sp. S44760]|nr:hypothetical protein [Bachmanniomyces sp. S44760]
MSHLSNPLEGTAALFGGLCYDEEEGSWMKCYVIAHDGKIDYADPHYDRIRETPGSQLEITAAQAEELVAHISMATACLFLQDCEITQMSGFFLDEELFITCAHFNPDASVERKMRQPNSNRAFVNQRPRAIYPYDGCHTLHLVHMDKQRDVAIFRLDPGQKATLALDQVPDFTDAFQPGNRTLSIGRLLGPDSSENSSVKWCHTMSGWFGISGGVIAMLEHQKGEEPPKVTVLGLFTGGKFAENWNQMVPLDQNTIETIKQLQKSD